MSGKCCSGKCKCQEKHEGHMCVLKSKGVDISALTDNPTVVCFTCGAEANSADNVCVPMPIAK
ncbi:MAG: hypothetical protein WCJ56_13690 [bacterium]